MGMYLLMPWRNLWRNKHRTLITTASIFFAALLVLFVRSMQLGSYRHIIETTVRISTGYLQVHAAGFWEKRSMDNTMALPDSLIQRIRGMAPVTAAVTRFESFALASHGDNTRGIMITGIQPQGENRMAGLVERITAGEYLSDTSTGVLLGEKCAEYLGASVGDTIVFLGQGYRGISAAGVFPVRGIVHLPIPELDQSIVYMPLQQAQDFYSAPDRSTSLVVMIDDPDRLGAVKRSIGDMLNTAYEVMDWREMAPELVQSIEFDNLGGLIMLGILYVVIGFGIFGTILMMTVERRKEFAVLLSVGMKRWRLNLVILSEAVVIGLFGLVLGAAAAVPLLLYMRAHPIRMTGQAAEAMLQYGFEPILPFLVEPSMFLNQGLTVLLISLAASLYPLWSIHKFDIAQALHA